MSLTRVTVAVEPPYDVVVGPGALAELPALVGRRPRRVALVHPARLRDRAGRVGAALAEAGHDLSRIVVPDGERAKTLAVASHCWSKLGDSRFARDDVVVGLGGGATTDLAGFVAACWLRGVRVVQVPTTVLGMVDAAVGGKTAVNTAAGKNLVGAFHQPAGVVCDLDVLSTLPREERASGLAEVVKCGFVVDPTILDLLEADPGSAADGPVLRELVERAVKVKARVVAGDPRERVGGHVGREVLNYGHTLGHAIERVEGYRWRHGAAISVGMMFAAELARLAGRVDDAVVERHRRVLQGLGLPTTYAGAPWPELRAAMAVDKKVRDDGLRLVVLEGLARPTVLAGPPDDLLAAAFAAVRPDFLR